MINERMEKHLKLCKKNLKDERVKCCLECPFEDDIKKYDPTTIVLFGEKRYMNFMKNQSTS